MEIERTFSTFKITCTDTLEYHFSHFPDYQAIFQHLEEVVGSVDMRDSFVCEVIKEAGKFKEEKVGSGNGGQEWRTSLRQHSKPDPVAAQLASPVHKICMSDGS